DCQVAYSPKLFRGGSIGPKLRRCAGVARAKLRLVMMQYRSPSRAHPARRPATNHPLLIASALLQRHAPRPTLDEDKRRGAARPTAPGQGNQRSEPALANLTKRRQPAPDHSSRRQGSYEAYGSPHNVPAPGPDTRPDSIAQSVSDPDQRAQYRGIADSRLSRPGAGSA